jgi:D-aminopeptidase
VAQGLISEAAQRAVTRLLEEDVPQPFVLDVPLRVTVEFFTSDMADKAARIPFTRREGTCVSLTADDMVAAYNGFRAMVMLASG